MDGAVVGVMCAGLVVLAVGLIVVAIVLQKRREERWRFFLRGWAKQRGWQVTFDPQVDWPERLPGRHKRGVTMVLSGVLNGRRVAVGDYHHTTTTTSPGPNGTTSTTTHTHRHIVTVVWLNRPTPSVAIHHRGPVSRLGRRMFGDPATATGHAEFDRRFRIESRTPDEARRLFGPALIAEHLADRLPLWNLHNGNLLAHQNGRIKEPDAAVTMITPLIRVADLLGR
jgi:hypothetical protein